MEPKIIEVFLNVGAFGAISILLWQRLGKMTDMYVDGIKSLTQTHKEEMYKLAERYEHDRISREERYIELTEKVIESMARLEVITTRIIQQFKLTDTKNERLR